MKTAEKLSPVKIRVEKNGDFQIADVDAFFKRPEVKRRIEIMRNADIAGKVLVGNKLISKEDYEK